MELLFIIYVTIRKTYYLKMLLYCPQLNCVNIGSYAHDESNTGEKIVHWGARNLCSTNGLEDTFVFPYNDRSHWSLFISKCHHTLHFLSILGYHNTWKLNQFVKCATFGWSNAKGIPHNLNKWAVIGIRPIVHV